MAIGELLLDGLVEQVLVGGELLLASDWQDSIYLSISLFHGEPIVANELGLFIGLNVKNVDHIEIPGLVTSVTAVVVPDT